MRPGGRRTTRPRHALERFRTAGPHRARREAASGQRIAASLLVIGLAVVLVGVVAVSAG